MMLVRLDATSMTAQGQQILQNWFFDFFESRNARANEWMEDAGGMEECGCRSYCTYNASIFIAICCCALHFDVFSFLLSLVVDVFE